MDTWANNRCNFLLLFLVIFGLYQVSYSVAAGAPNACNVFEGSWVYDKSYPLYDNNTCPFVEKEFNCQKNGRPDTDYLKYRWQPTKCNLPRFDGEDFLRRYRGKKIMFVGDSLTRDMWASLTCLLYTSAPSLSYKLIRVGLVSNFTIPEYNITVWLDRSSFLVDLIDTPSGKILKLDSIKDGKNWLGMDMLIFNTWHWWGYKHKAQVWDYISVNDTLLKDMDRTEALKIAMRTWGHWVDANINPNKTKVFWQGISPNHYTSSSNLPNLDAPLEGDPIHFDSYETIYNLKVEIGTLKAQLTCKITDFRYAKSLYHEEMGARNRADRECERLRATVLDLERCINHLIEELRKARDGEDEDDSSDKRHLDVFICVLLPED